MNFANFYNSDLLNKSSSISLIHGTSSTFLNNILKNGLDANSKIKSYGGEKLGSIDQENNESIGGIYLTKNLITARSAAIQAVKKHSGEKMYCIVDVDLNTAVADEDNITPIIVKTIEKLLGSNIHNYFFIYGTFVSNKNEEMKIKNLFANDIHKLLSDDNNLLDKKLLFDVFTSYLIRILSYLKKDNKRLDDYKDGLLSSQDIDVDNVSFPNEIPDPKIAENNYKNNLDKLTKKYKNIVNQIKNNDMINLSVLSNIELSGKNKIISIVIEHDSENIEIVYGQENSFFIKEWKSKISNKVNIIKK